MKLANYIRNKISFIKNQMLSKVEIDKFFNTPIDKVVAEVYEKYNEIQRSQGLDLRKYKNKRIKRYSYEVKNYPGEIANIRANLLISDGMIVGGDVCSIEIGGFMHGFQKT